MRSSLGSFLFARRYLGNSIRFRDWSLFLQVLKCFTSLGLLVCVKRKRTRFNAWVSSFGNLRIDGCSTPPRSLSQLCYVLHRLLKPRHPPYALAFPSGNARTTILCSVTRNQILDNRFWLSFFYLLRLQHWKDPSGICNNSRKSCRDGMKFSNNRRCGILKWKQKIRVAADIRARF